MIKYSLVFIVLLIAGCYQPYGRCNTETWKGIVKRSNAQIERCLTAAEDLQRHHNNDHH